MKATIQASTGITGLGGFALSLLGLLLGLLLTELPGTRGRDLQHC